MLSACDHLPVRVFSSKVTNAWEVLQEEGVNNLMRRDPLEWGPGEALHSSGSCLCLTEFHYYLTDTWEATRGLAVNRMAGAGYVNGA